MPDENPIPISQEKHRDIDEKNATSSSPTRTQNFWKALTEVPVFVGDMSKRVMVCAKGVPVNTWFKILAMLPFVAAALGCLWIPNMAWAYSLAALHLLIGAGFTYTFLHKEKCMQKEDLWYIVLVVLVESLLAAAAWSQFGVRYVATIPHLHELAHVGTDNITFNKGWKGGVQFRRLHRKYSPGGRSRLSSDEFRLFLCDVLSTSHNMDTVMEELPKSTHLRYFAKSSFKCPE